MDVSVIIVNYNTTDLVIDCLNTVYKYTKDLLFEVIVVDNNSPDRSIENLNDYFPQVKLVLNDKNSGFGAANNLGNKYAKGKYLFLLNSDTLLLDNAIKSFFDFMEKTPDAGVCGGNLLTKDLKPNMSFLRIMPGIRSILNNLFFGFFSYIFYKENYTYATRRDILQINGFISGADFFIRRELYDKIGGFDEDFFMYYEEVELTNRIRKLGYKSFIIPCVNIVHFEEGSQKENTRKKEWIKKSHQLYYEKTEKKGYTISLLLNYLIDFKQQIKKIITNE